jgi:hypothetical protein
MPILKSRVSEHGEDNYLSLDFLNRHSSFQRQSLLDHRIYESLSSFLKKTVVINIFIDCYCDSGFKI